ncbi:hypothetical protein J3Q64DRAFT_1048323 [Phycomyces blakesleeanus]|uniref:Uncharacterized protein n=2 Tax=Phycomyces blakesleeanus TaxID=4837 RepID=A0A162NE93_PHYB8|nr:hypothetical protein PHYBLDRAFT_173169 [Phycomyces blakesleeanus NRRL 1555(-)]OAD68754.1 hypothetical protein PHYBLDRAFT_173169 [Phycomyces blakesleeanus NRRL 1555(-)]|eukprot:XP_018286794.1 hypothetical protein PHYBLDRAFT_173169 [Phycomyces blakesleeanus NRRL 1555(-)]
MVYSPWTFRCCGCIDNRIGSMLACILWAAFSFYLAILAFMGSSPFFSHLDKIPLIVFGVINIFFGLVSLSGFIILIVRSRYFAPRKSLVYLLVFSASAVLVDLFINLVLFGVDKSSFQEWCVEQSLYNFKVDFQKSTNITTVPINADSDFYNCNRLYEDEFKWSLMAVVGIFIVYIHWILVIMSYIQSYRALFSVGYPNGSIVPVPLEPVLPAPPMVETMLNIPPKRKEILNYQNVKPGSLKKIIGRFRRENIPFAHERWDKLGQDDFTGDHKHESLTTLTNLTSNADHSTESYLEQEGHSITPKSSRTFVLY